MCDLIAVGSVEPAVLASARGVRGSKAAKWRILNRLVEKHGKDDVLVVVIDESNSSARIAAGDTAVHPSWSLGSQRRPRPSAAAVLPNDTTAITEPLPRGVQQRRAAVLDGDDRRAFGHGRFDPGRHHRRRRKKQRAERWRQRQATQYAGPRGTITAGPTSKRDKPPMVCDSQVGARDKEKQHRGMSKRKEPPAPAPLQGQKRPPSRSKKARRGYGTCTQEKKPKKKMASSTRNLKRKTAPQQHVAAPPNATQRRTQRNMLRRRKRKEKKKNSDGTSGRTRTRRAGTTIYKTSRNNPWNGSHWNRDTSSAFIQDLALRTTLLTDPGNERQTMLGPFQRSATLSKSKLPNMIPDFTRAANAIHRAPAPPADHQLSAQVATKLRASHIYPRGPPATTTGAKNTTTRPQGDSGAL